MRRPILLILMMALALVAASGVALAVTRDCKALESCFGSKGSDTMRGSTGADFMYGLAGNDTMKGNDDGDEMVGGKGADKVYGMRGHDSLYGHRGADVIYGGRGNESHMWGGELNVHSTVPYSDNSDDRVYGGPGNDSITGGRALGGVDRIFGGDGDDHIDAEQTADGPVLDYAVTKEIVDCGAGNDTVFYDPDLDVLENCENALPYRD